jgi:carboxyl-terminal processing protease
MFKRYFGLALTIATLYAEEPVKPKPMDDELVFTWSRTTAEIMHLLVQKHYHVSNFEQCMIKGLDTILNTADPHSNLLDPKIYKAMLEATSGEFFGIGIIIDNTRSSKDKFLTIVGTIADGPADKAGVKQFDKIVEIDGNALEGMTTDEATAKLKGERNTKVNVKALREGHTEMISFDITRDIIKEQTSLSFYIEDQNIYYLSLSMFSENAAQQLEKLLEKAKSNPYKGLILDLRNNSGGLLSSAIDIAGLFLDPNSTVVTTKDKTGAVTEEYKTNRQPAASHTPIFIMINNFTASAAEILAGALKIHAEHVSGKKNNQMVFLAGTRTFGKGSVQEVIPISNNCAVKITTSLYFLPNDTTVQGEGIAPDFEIERRTPPTESQLWFTKNYGRESALPNYIKAKPEDEAEKKKKEEEEKKKKKETKSWNQRAQEALEADNQLRETINLINLLHSGQHNCPGTIKTRADALKFMQNIFVTGKQLKFVEVKI